MRRIVFGLAVAALTAAFAEGEYAWRGVHLDEARHFFGRRR